MNTIENKKPTSILSGIPITLNYKDLSKPVLSWIKKIMSGENAGKNYIFAKTRWDNSIAFYNEEGLLFGQVNLGCRLPVELITEEFIVGIIKPDSQDGNPDVANLSVKLYANPKENNKSTAELAKFRKEMIQKFG